MSRVSNLGRILASPSSVARDVIRDPHWAIPLIVVMAVSCFSALSTYQYQVKFQREQVGPIIKERNPDADIDSMFKATTRGHVISGVLAVVAVGVITLIFSGVLKGAASVAGGQVGFRPMFAFVSYTMMVSAIGGIIKVPLILAKGSLDVRTSLAALAPALSMRSPLFVFLGSLVTVCLRAST
jgi:hypothetical protein